MTNTDIVPTQEKCQLLKDNGFPQKGSCFIFGLMENNNEWRLLLRSTAQPNTWCIKEIAAPTETEMKMFLKENGRNLLIDYLETKYGRVPFWHHIVYWYQDLLPNELADACLWVLEEEK